MKTYDIYGIGAALVDMELEVTDEFLQAHAINKGQMTLVSPEAQQTLLKDIQAKQVKTKRASGGSAANTLFAAASFGAKTYYSCKTANDKSGQFFKNDMNQAGVDCSDSADEKIQSDLPTGTCLVMVTPDAERTMNTYLGISASLSSDSLNKSALKNATYFYMEGYLATSDSGRAAAIEGRLIAENNQVKTALTFSDFAMVNFFKNQLQDMLGESGVDLLFCNQEEALAWNQSTSLDETLEDLKKICKSFAVTLGANGAVVFDGKSTFKVPAPAIKPVDSNGAGDMFAGAFLYAITHGKNFQEAGTFACAAAAQVVSQFGPRITAAQHKLLLRKL